MAREFDPGGFSNVDASGSPAEYSANLDRARAIGVIVENRRLVRDALALAAGDVVLDVGSGTGEEAQAIAELVAPGGRVVGVDLSVALVEEARRRLPETVGNVEFAVADAQALPFPDGEFDAVRAERLLQHVEDPAHVAREMVRVARTGGRVAGWEPDWGLTFVSSSDPETSALVCERVARTTRNPMVGRNLAALFGRAGLVDVRVVARIGLWDALETVEERLSPTMTVRALVTDGTLADARATGWLQELRDDAEAGRLVAGVCGFVVSGKKAT